MTLLVRTMVVLVLGVVAPTSTASAQGLEALRLTWNAPDDCARAEEVRARTLAVIGVSNLDATPLDASVHVRREGDRIEINVTTTREGVHGTRQLYVSSCDLAVNATALILAYALDPHLLEQTLVETPSEPSSELVADTRAPATEITPSMGAARRGLTHAVRLGAGMSTNIGALPSLGVGPSAHVVYSLNAFELHATASYIAFAHATLEEQAGIGAAFDSLSIAFAAGYRLAFGPLEFVPALGMVLGRVGGEGTGVRMPRRADHAYAAPYGAVHLRYPIGERFALELAARLELPLTHFEFEITGAGSVHRVENVALTSSLSLSMRIL